MDNIEGPFYQPKEESVLVSIASYVSNAIKPEQQSISLDRYIEMRERVMDVSSEEKNWRSNYFLNQDLFKIPKNVLLISELTLRAYRIGWDFAYSDKNNAMKDFAQRGADKHLEEFRKGLEENAKRYQRVGITPKQMFTRRGPESFQAPLISLFTPIIELQRSKDQAFIILCGVMPGKLEGSIWWDALISRNNERTLKMNQNNWYSHRRDTQALFIEVDEFFR